MAFSADTRALRNMGRQLRQIDAALYRETQKSLRVVGERIAGRARQRAGEFAKTPPTVKVSASGLSAVIVRADGPTADWKAIENHGKGHVRHPVFGDRGNWTDLHSPPAFLLPAATEDLRKDAADVAEALTVRVEKTIHGQSGFF